MIALYIRVSSEDQSTASQEQEIAKWLEYKSLKESGVIRYADSFTGTTMERPGFDKLLADMRRRKFTKLVVWRVDRLARNAAGLLTFIEELQALGIEFVSIRDNLDLSTPTGRMMLVFLAGIAAWETETRRERQMAGIESAKKSGRYKGRKPGYRKADTERVFELKDKGLTNPEISEALGVSVRTVVNYLGQGRNDA